MIETTIDGVKYDVHMLYSHIGGRGQGPRELAAIYFHEGGYSQQKAAYRTIIFGNGLNGKYYAGMTKSNVQRQTGRSRLAALRQLWYVIHELTMYSPAYDHNKAIIEFALQCVRKHGEVLA